MAVQEGWATCRRFPQHETLVDYYARPDDADYLISMSRSLRTVQYDPRWMKLQIAYAEIHGYGRLFRSWGYGLFAPIPGEGVALYEVVRDFDNETGFSVNMVPEKEAKGDLERSSSGDPCPVSTRI